jgi:phosphomevalonate kinase
MDALAEIARAASRAVEEKDANKLVAAIGESLGALTALASAADAPIVPDAFAALGVAARSEQAAFVPSGAGGGDIGVFVGTAPPSASFTGEAKRLGMTRVPLAIESRGVRLATS